VISEITDIMDGHIARTRGQVSDIGKLMDPFSDVFLRITFFVCFIGAGLMPLWAFIIIVWRELGIMFIRMLLAKEGTAMAANKGGKLKSLLYAFSSFGGIVVLGLRSWWPDVSWLTTAEFVSRYLFALAAAAAIVSFFGYLRSYIASDTHRRFMNE
jgi:CDP-diacylglycerol--glycerol-3-phosphate 3-phosphatidyltransferase